jgi:predicted DCC family thiol-disulfide oxidoreductase YuxK
MFQFCYNKIYHLLHHKVSATGIGLFRTLYGLVTLQEIVFLFYFRHLIFDPIPFLDVEFPAIPMFLLLWGIAASCLTVGYRYQLAVTANYIFWLVFVNFTPMQRDFDGGFDTFMIGMNFFLLFMPGDRALSLDNLRYKLNAPFKHYSEYPKAQVPELAYYLPVFIGLGFLYFDSDVHKLSADHWRNGLGTWLPATQPYYVSALDMSALLNLEWLQKTIGYSILLFQATFLFFFNHKTLRYVYLLFGIGLHLGITITLNIYPFGLGMLICYTLLVPEKWWSTLGNCLRSKTSRLTVFFDRDCPLCNRTVLTLNHFDILGRIDFKNAQDNAHHYPAVVAVGMPQLLKDLYAYDASGKLYYGVETYRQILIAMGYPALLGILLGLPLIRSFAEKKYRAIADQRQRIDCDKTCIIEKPIENSTLYQQLFVDYAEQKPKAAARKITKFAIVFAVLQIICTLHYGVFYRLSDRFLVDNSLTQTVSQVSNALLLVAGTFLGITPHALYLHDHFEGYDRILALTYRDDSGQENWLPFVNEQGRLLAPNWGRVHSMWANIAVTPTIDNARFRKFTMKVTAFWGQKLGVNLDRTVFKVKMKKINAPSYWVFDQLHHNFSSPWLDIGTVRWRQKNIEYNLPSDLNKI